MAGPLRLAADPFELMAVQERRSPRASGQPGSHDGHLAWRREMERLQVAAWFTRAESAGPPGSSRWAVAERATGLGVAARRPAEPAASSRAGLAPDEPGAAAATTLQPMAITASQPPCLPNGRADDGERSPLNPPPPTSTAGSVTGVGAVQALPAVSRPTPLTPWVSTVPSSTVPWPALAMMGEPSPGAGTMTSGFQGSSDSHSPVPAQRGSSAPTLAPPCAALESGAALLASAEAALEPGPRGSAALEKMVAEALAREARPRLHVQWDGTAARIWMGVDGMPDTAELLRTLQRVLRRSGLELHTLVCNGRILITSRVVPPFAAPSTHQES